MSSNNGTISAFIGAKWATVMVGVALVAAGVAVAPTVTGGGGGGGSCDRTATTSTYSTQLSAATAGQTLCLASGTYSFSNTSKSSPGITITAQPGASVTFSSINLSLGSNQNWTIDGTLMGGTVSIGGGSWTGSTTTARNLTVRNSAFTAPLTIDGPTNSNIMLDGNTHNNIRCTAANARVWLSYTPSGPSGVTVQNSVMIGNSADGIQAGAPMTILNNYFQDITEGVDTSCHTDSIQLFCGCTSSGSGAGTGSTIRGNYIVDSAVGIAGYDGGHDHVISNNVVRNIPDNKSMVLGGCANCTVEWNTLTNSQIDLTSKAGQQTTAAVVRNNIATGMNLSGGGCGCTATLTTNANNMFPSGASGSNFNGTPTYTGGGSPTTFAGHALTSLSAGYTGATDGGQVGALGNSFTGGPPGG